MNEEQLLKLIEKLNLPKEEYYILSGGSMVIRKLREKTNDLDLCVTEKCFEILKNRFGLENIKPNKLGAYIITENIECFIDKKENFCVETINDYQIQSLEELLKFKTEMNREKDKMDIQIITKYLSERKYK